MRPLLLERPPAVLGGGAAGVCGAGRVGCAAVDQLLTAFSPPVRESGQPRTWCSGRGTAQRTAMRCGGPSPCSSPQPTWQNAHRASSRRRTMRGLRDETSLTQKRDPCIPWRPISETSQKSNFEASPRSTLSQKSLCSPWRLMRGRSRVGLISQGNREQRWRKQARVPGPAPPARPSSATLKSLAFAQMGVGGHSCAATLLGSTLDGNAHEGGLWYTLGSTGSYETESVLEELQIQTVYSPGLGPVLGFGLFLAASFWLANVAVPNFISSGGAAPGPKELDERAPFDPFKTAPDGSTPVAPRRLRPGKEEGEEEEEEKGP